jgi:methylated-DNA-[protein]-cysteine S-methyltransferase
MKGYKSENEPRLVRQLRSVLAEPREAFPRNSPARIRRSYTTQAPVIQWDEMSSPLGPLFVAINPQGVCALDFGRNQAHFLSRLDPRAQTTKDPQALADVVSQLRQYFAGRRCAFRLAVDISGLTPFQRSVLELTSRIAPGQVWTYGRVAEELGRSESSRAVGQALARNPVPIVIPCHRVIASDGGMGGYSGGSGIQAKRWLLQLEGAL